jgi:antitoxin VapB
MIDINGGAAMSQSLTAKPSGRPGVQKARVFRNGRSQAVRIPAEYRFNTDEVYVRRDEATGDLILSQRSPMKVDWDRIFAILDAAGFPDDFMADREQGLADAREPL